MGDVFGPGSVSRQGRGPAGAAPPPPSIPQLPPTPQTAAPPPPTQQGATGGTGGCRSSADCPPEYPVCSGGRCHASGCQSDADCPEGRPCIQGKCRGGRTKPQDEGDCPEGCYRDETGFCDCGTPGPQQPPADNRCPTRNGIQQRWDEGRQRCTFAGCPPGQGYLRGSQGCQPCPQGTSTSEQGRCLPGLDGGGGGGGAGGGGGGGGFAGAFPATDYERKLAAMLEGIGGNFENAFADFYGIAFPAYAQATDYYSTLLGAGGRSKMQALTAPAAEQIAQGQQGAERAIGAGYLRGGARDAAIADTQREQAGATARLTQGVQGQAAGALGQLGAAGTGLAFSAEQSAASIYGKLADTAVSSRLSTESMQLTRELGFANIELGYAGLDLQRDLGFAGLDYQYDALRQAAEQFAKSLEFQQQQAGANRSQGLGLGIGGIFGSIISAIIGKGGR